MIDHNKNITYCHIDKAIEYFYGLQNVIRNHLRMARKHAMFLFCLIKSNKYEKKSFVVWMIAFQLSKVTSFVLRIN